MDSALQQLQAYLPTHLASFKEECLFLKCFSVGPRVESLGSEWPVTCQVSILDCLWPEDMRL